MKLRHNKKRNVGIIYEQLSQAFSESLVEKDKKRSMLVKKIIDDHYQKDGEIFKEFKIFNALLKVYAGSDSLATSILQEAKNATRNLNKKKLAIEKSLLIKDINYTLNEGGFYSRKVPNYRNLATIQSMMNLWSQNSKDDFEKLVMFESKVHELLREEKSKFDIKQESNQEVNSLVVKIMQDKFHKKYKPILSERQSKIIESYVFGNSNELKILLSEVKNEVIEKTRDFKRNCDNRILLEKSGEVVENLSSLDDTKIDDDNISKFLLACKLCEQLEERK